MDVVRLQEVVAKATEATTTEQVARILVDEGAGVLGAAMGGLWRLDGDELVLVHFGGGKPAGRFQRLPLDANAPLAACVRDRQPIWLADAEEYRRRFPDSHARLDAQVGCACLPLIVAGQPIGGAVFAFEGTRVFTDDEQASLMLIARQCASVLERLRLAAAAQQLAGRMTALQAIAGRLARARGLDAIVRIVI
ncbi:MAG TPA: GAF domain-containing protein, partial [Kofleriaceae bacterium]|nr:GAF domain-containing protein [Kofleriaceae bacterium]